MIAQVREVGGKDQMPRNLHSFTETGSTTRTWVAVHKCTFKDLANHEY